MYSLVYSCVHYRLHIETPNQCALRTLRQYGHKSMTAMVGYLWLGHFYSHNNKSEYDRIARCTPEQVLPMLRHFFIWSDPNCDSFDSRWPHTRSTRCIVEGEAIEVIPRCSARLTVWPLIPSSEHCADNHKFITLDTCPRAFLCAPSVHKPFSATALFCRAEKSLYHRT